MNRNPPFAQPASLPVSPGEPAPVAQMAVPPSGVICSDMQVDVPNCRR